MSGWGPGWAGTCLLHAVVHGQQRLQPLPLQHVGELHVNGLHGADVAHDPVLVWVGGVVVAGRSGGEEREMEAALWERVAGPPLHPPEAAAAAGSRPPSISSSPPSSLSKAAAAESHRH